MSKLLLSFACLLVTIHCVSQTKIPTPKNKANNYEDHKLYYEEWLDKIKSTTHNIQGGHEQSHNVMSNHYWNRFNTYYKLIPDERSDILYIFFDAFNYDKDVFCQSYIKITNEMRLHEWASKNYGTYADQMDRMCDCVVNSYNKNLIVTLDSLRSRDQRYRGGHKISSRKQHELDSLNLITVRHIIDRYGYPNRTIVGPEYESYAFYIIQHSNLEAMEEFLPLIRENTDKNLISRTLLPYLIDRIHMIKEEPQLYGTQSQYDEEHNLKLYKLQNDINTTNQLRERYDLKALDMKSSNN